MRWLLVELLLLTAAVLGCGGQALLPQACPHPRFFSTPSNDEKVHFLDNECKEPCVNGPMNDTSVTVCINPCGATNISFLARYESLQINTYKSQGVTGYKSQGIKYVQLSIPNDGGISFSVNLEFNSNETSVSLTLYSREITRTTKIKNDKSNRKKFSSWAVKKITKNLPFRVISNYEQCGPPITTTKTIFDMETTSTRALFTASAEETLSADAKKSKPEVILAENKYAFAAGGGLGIILIIVVIIIAVCRVRKKRSNAEPGVPNVKGGTPALRGGLTRHCSVNSLYDASSPKPLERHESVNSLYGTHDTEYLSTATLNQLLRPSPHGQVNSDLKNTLPGSTVHYESENSLYYNPTEDTDKSAQGIRNIYDPV